MKKPLKMIAIVVAVAIVLIVVAAIALILFVDPSRYRDDIVQAVKQQTGRDLKIEGKLSLSFYPWIGLETKRLELSNAPGFGKEPFAVVDSLATKVELLPLLRKQVVVDAVRLNGLKLHLARNAKGETNWDDLTKPTAEKPAPKPTPAQGGAGAALAAFTINTFQVRDSEFTWRDDTAKQQYAVRRLDLTSGNLLGGAPAPLKLGFNLESKNPPIKERVELDARLRFDLEKAALQVPQLTLSLGDLRLKARLTGSNVLSRPKVAGSIEVPTFDARALLDRLGVDYKPADANALRKVGLSTQLAYDARASALSDLKLALDGTRITGSLAVENQPATAYRFNLALDDIDIDRYLPPAAKPANDKPSAGNAEPIAIPIALLRKTDAKGELHLGKLKAFGIRSHDIMVRIAAKDGHITLGPNAAKLYSGAYSGRTVVDASGKVPQFRFEEKLAGVQLEPFLKDAQVYDRFAGAANIDLKLTAQGLDAEAIKRSLDGTAAFNVKNGAIEGVDLKKIEAKVREVRDRPGGTAKDLLAALPEFKPATGDKTAFTHLQASVTVAKGIVSNKDLVIEAPPLRVTGNGTVNLAASTFDNYVLHVGNIPMVVSGPFDGPKIRPDWNAIFRAKTEQKAEQKKEEVKQEFRDKLRNRLLDKLKR